ncbi:MAG: endonuclease domain-containing protein [Ruminococcus sp.]
MNLPRNKQNLNLVKALRKNMTKEENHLWYDFLRICPFRFRRQELIGNYIADFYCDKAMLVIEIDGSQHYEPDALEYDRKRTDFFNSLNIDVLRFTNIEVAKNFEGVCETILLNVNKRVKFVNEKIN